MWRGSLRCASLPNPNPPPTPLKRLMGDPGFNKMEQNLYVSRLRQAWQKATDAEEADKKTDGQPPDLDLPMSKKGIEKCEARWKETHDWEQHPFMLPSF